MEDLTGAIKKVGAAAKNALEGNAKALRGFRAFGISNEDLRNLKDFELLQKVMAGGQGMSKATEEANLRNLGIKNPSLIINAAPQLANFGEFAAGKEKTGQIASPEQLRQLQELKFQFDALSDTIKTKMVPILLWLINTFNYAVVGFKVLGQIIYSVIGLITNTVVEVGLFIKNIFTEGWKAAGRDFVNNVANDASYAIKTGLIDGIGGIVDTYDKKEAAIQAKIEAFMKDQESKGETGGADREVANQKVPEMGSNQFLKIGGLMGTDVDMKIMMINQQIEDNTKQAAITLQNIFEALNKDNGKTMGVNAGGTFPVI